MHARASTVMAALVFGVAAVPAAAQTQHLDAATRTAILAGSYRTVVRVADIPPAVMAAAAAARGPDLGGYPLEMADPGQPFQATDVIVDKRLPGRRLIAAYASTAAWIVHYEAGGVAHTYHIAFFRLHGKRATFVWQASVPRTLSGIVALQELVRSDKQGAIDDSYTRFY
jgi:hypothetical protein